MRIRPLLIKRTPGHQVIGEGLRKSRVRGTVMLLVAGIVFLVITT